MSLYKRRKLILLQQLQGAGYYDAIAAFNFAAEFHTGTRKDGETPEFQHQIEIALFAMLLPDLIYREETLCAIALHDTPEDFGIDHDEYGRIFKCSAKRELVVDAVKAMTKKYRGYVRDPEEVFASIAASPVASIAKGCDRQHNFLSMVGVFTPEKQRSYVTEGRERFLPMLKTAKRNFPHQTRAYELLKFNLTSQMELIESALTASDKE